MKSPRALKAAAVFAALVLSGSALTQQLKYLELESETIIGGYRMLGTVKLDLAAPAGGLDVAMTSNMVDKVQVPALVHVNEGSKMKTFGVLTQTVLDNTPVVLTATYDGTVVDHTLLLLPGGLTDMACDTPLCTGDIGKGQAWLSGNTAVDVDIELLSDNPAVASVPAFATVLAGDHHSNQFDIIAGAVVADTYVTIRARLDVSIRTETIVVRAENMSLAFKVFKSNGVPRNNALVMVTYSDGSTENQYTNAAGKAVFHNLVAGPATFIEIRPGNKDPFGPYAFVVDRCDPTLVTFTEP